MPKSAGKVSNKAATKIDKLIGRNIRIHRLIKGLTQGVLGEILGVTFQQIQKYENGTNRVGSGRLYQIAATLEVPISAFFDGKDKAKAARDSSPFDLLNDPLTLQMALAFSKLTDRKTRRALLSMMETLVATV